MHEADNSYSSGRVIDWTNFSHKHSVHGLHRNVQDFTELSTIYLLGFVDVELPFCEVVTLS